MKTRLPFSFIALIALILILASCSSTKNFKENQYLLTQNKMTFTGKNPGIDASELQGLIQQKPNKKFLAVVRFKLWAYNRAIRKGKKTKFRNWMENTVGERPVILDTFMANKSCREMEKYLGNVGYFYSKVDFSVEYKKNKKRAHVRYTITPSQPYHIKSIKYNIDNPVLLAYVQQSKSASLIKIGNIYNVYTLDKERERISQFLNNNGYYGFVKDYIFFEIDSSLSKKEMAISLDIKNISIQDPDSAGKFIEEDHYRYKIDKVTVFPNFDPSGPKIPKADMDTLETEIHQINKNHPANYYYIIYHGKLRINPGILTQTILIEDGDPYKLKDVQETYKRFGSLSIYNYANIQFLEIKESDSLNVREFKKLECRINLQRAPLHQYSVEAEGTNSGGDLGVGGNITYSNRNIFRNGETFRLKFKGAMEAQRSEYTEQDQQKFLFFNTFEWGAEATIKFPRFLIPVKMERFPKYFRPTTTMGVGFNYRTRPTYDRYIINLTFGYKWQESAYKTHIVQPFNISSVKVYPTPEFTKDLNEINDPRLKNQYTDHLITALQYSFIFNNQNLKKVQDFIYFKGDIETSGNLFYLFNNMLDSQVDSLGAYTIASIPYAQYARIEIDFRYYWMLSQTNQLVFRAMAGFGLPYGNSKSLPFEKGFYLGGANSMRAWIYRGLGPGGFQDPGTNIDKMGDMLFEGNVEYRFPIYSFFKGALFCDAGNVWLIYDNENFENAKFSFDTFYKQIALDAGVGFRFDFKFFIFRVDFAWRLRDPGQPKSDRWVASKGIWFWNFGIGYPF